MKVERYSPEDKRIGKIFRTVAETGFGISISDAILQDWNTVSDACLHADDIYDNHRGKEDRQSFADSTIAYILARTDELQASDESFILKVQKLKLIVQILSEERQQKFVTHIRLFLNVTEQLREETDPKKVSILTRLEGQMAARAYFDVLPDEVRQHPNFHRFSHTVKVIARVSNSLDTFTDLTYDYEEGRVRLEPTLRNRMYLLRNTVCEGLSVITNIKPTAIKQIAGISIRNYVHRKGILR